MLCADLFIGLYRPIRYQKLIYSFTLVLFAFVTDSTVSVGRLSVLHLTYLFVDVYPVRPILIALRLSTASSNLALKALLMCFFS